MEEVRNVYEIIIGKSCKEEVTQKARTEMGGDYQNFMKTWYVYRDT
jgi:hypothetical protein